MSKSSGSYAHSGDSAVWNRRRIGRVEDALADQKDNVDFAMAQTQLAEAAARLKVVQALKKGNRGRG